MKLAYFLITFGTPSIPAGGRTAIVLTSSEPGETDSVAVDWPSGASTVVAVRDALLVELLRCGYQAVPNSTTQILLFVETTGDTIVPSLVLTSGSSMGFTAVTQRTSLVRSTALIAAAELARDTDVAAANAARVTAEAQLAASQAALLVALNDDVSVASSLAQLTGQLAACQYEIDQLTISAASNLALSEAKESEIQRLSALAADADRRADRARATAGIATALSVVGAAAAKRVPPEAAGRPTSGWRKAGA